MCLSVLAQCGRRLTPTITRQCVTSIGFYDFPLNIKRHYFETSLLTCNSLSSREWYFGLQPKFCSSSCRDNPSNLKQMKERVNQYIDILNKGSDLNYANVVVASKELMHTIRTDVVDLKSCPIPPLVLGFGGLIPFVAVPAHFMMSAAFSPGVAYGQIAYGAVILSFLGGIRWGVALNNPKWDNLTKSVIPSLVGWSALLVPHWLGCLTLGAGLVSMAVIDRKHPQYQPWFRSLRVALTTIAVLSITGSLFLGLVLPVSKN